MRPPIETPQAGAMFFCCCFDLSLFLFPFCRFRLLLFFTPATADKTDGTVKGTETGGEWQGASGGAVRNKYASSFGAIPAHQPERPAEPRAIAAPTWRRRRWKKECLVLWLAETFSSQETKEERYREWSIRFALRLFAIVVMESTPEFSWFWNRIENSSCTLPN